MVKQLAFVVALTLLALEVASISMWLVLGEYAHWGVWPGVALAVTVGGIAGVRAGRAVWVGK